MSNKIVNQQRIKETNLKTLFNYVYYNDGISRTMLSKLSGLSKTTVSTLIDELISRKFICDSGISVTDSVGRKPNSLHINKGSYYIIDAAWIDSTITISLVDIIGEVVYEEHLDVVGEDYYLKITEECIYNSIINKVSKEQILGICVIVSAMIDVENKSLYTTTLSLSESAQANIVKDLKSTFKEFPIAIFNDTACYAFAEKIYANVTSRDFVFVNFSHGIGATLFIDNKMVGDASGATTQFGHYSVDYEGRLCVCGNRGCLEATMGEPVLKERVNELGESKYLSHLDKVTYSDLAYAYGHGDPIAKTLIESMAKELSFALVNLISIVNPEVIILGGDTKKLGESFLEEIKNNLNHIGIRRMVDNVEVSYSKLDHDSYMIGGMKYFFDSYFRFTEDSSNSLFIG